MHLNWNIKHTLICYSFVKNLIYKRCEHFDILNLLWFQHVIVLRNELPIFIQWKYSERASGFFLSLRTCVKFQKAEIRFKTAKKLLSGKSYGAMKLMCRRQDTRFSTYGQRVCCDLQIIRILLANVLLCRRC